MKRGRVRRGRGKKRSFLRDLLLLPHTRALTPTIGRTKNTPVCVCIYFRFQAIHKMLLQRTKKGLGICAGPGLSTEPKRAGHAACRCQLSSYWRPRFLPGDDNGPRPQRRWESGDAGSSVYGNGARWGRSVVLFFPMITLIIKRCMESANGARASLLCVSRQPSPRCV